METGRKKGWELGSNRDGNCEKRGVGTGREEGWKLGENRGRN